MFFIVILKEFFSMASTIFNEKWFTETHLTDKNIKMTIWLKSRNLKANLICFFF